MAGSDEANQILGLPKGGPVDFAIPGELWAVLGISVISLIGSPLILNGKKEKPANPLEVRRTERALAAADDLSTTNQGQLLVRACPEDARWEDLFQAEEVGNGAHLDLAKVQNFYFTLIVVVAYAESLFTMFGLNKPITQFPPVSEGMVALLAISHATYLANKARPHSQEGDGTAGDGTADNSRTVNPAAVKSGR